ncbi:hypothetical protein BV25DRAFT_1829260 [Artomyces pyxidatus]|uniref:Uncharacterized protein n=1 Tax=Artomyces pyxidatus TaxID=48021 RepID=A0ACB8SRT3_9AGAM|nr:hypothetical protein BV25DRAFT_1829260 [Artomyces pyxidatus]
MGKKCPFKHPAEPLLPIGAFKAHNGTVYFPVPVPSSEKASNGEPHYGFVTRFGVEFVPSVAPAPARSELDGLSFPSLDLTPTQATFGMEHPRLALFDQGLPVNPPQAAREKTADVPKGRCQSIGVGAAVEAAILKAGTVNRKAKKGRNGKKKVSWAAGAKP